MYKEMLFWLLGWVWIWQSHAEHAEVRGQLYHLRKCEHNIDPDASVTPVTVLSRKECAVRCSEESVCSGFHYDQSAEPQCQLLNAVDYRIPQGEWYLSEPST